MKEDKKSPTSKFGGSDVAGDQGIRQHKRLAMGMQGRVGTTKNPGSKGNRKPGSRKS